MKKIIYIVALFLCIGSIDVFAQCPTNIGFETGDLTGWVSEISGTGCTAGNPGTGANCAIPPSPANIITPLNTCNSLGQNAQILTNSRIQVCSATSTEYSNWLTLHYSGTDPWSGLPVVCPSGCLNNYTLKLGDDVANDSAESVTTNFLVSSSNSSLIYNYASIIYNGGTSHTYCTNSRLELEVFDLGTPSNLYTTPIIQSCASNIFPFPPNTNSTNVVNLPGWHMSTQSALSGQVFYSDWSSVAVNLSSLVGHVIKLKFSTGDCNLSGHWSYAYIDIPCGCTPFHIFTGYCPGQDTAILQAPQGFNSYQWINGGVTPHKIIGYGQILQAPTDSLINPNCTPYPCPVPIYLVVTPVGGVVCNDTLIDTLRAIPPPTAAFTHQQNICARSASQFYDSSFTQGWGRIIRWDWDFGDGSPHDTSQNPTHTYVLTGTYTVTLTVWSSLSCVSSTVLHPIVNVNIPAVNVNAGADIHICQNNIAQLNGSYFPTSPYTYHWYSLNGLSYPYNGLNFDSIYNPTANVLVNTSYVYAITDTVHHCVFTDTMQVLISGVAPNILVNAAKDTICPNTSVRLSVDPAPVQCGTTVLYCNGTPTNSQVGSGNTNITHDPTPFNGTYSAGRIQMLFLASELSPYFSAGEIDGLAFKITSKNSNYPFYDFSVKMGCSQLSQFNSSSTFVTGLSMVYSTMNFVTVIGNNPINFQNHFMWDGVSNIIVEVCFSGSALNSDYVSQTTSAFNSVIYDYANGSGVNGCSMTSGYLGIGLSTTRPSLIFNTCTPSTNGFTYAWTHNNTLAPPTSGSPIASPTVTTTYICTVTDPIGCFNKDSITIVVDNSASVNLGNDTTLCNGSIYQTHPIVSGYVPYNYSWSSSPVGFSSSIPSPILSPTVTTTYTLNFTDRLGCVKTDNVVVNINQMPTSTFSVSPNPVCTGVPVTIVDTGVSPPGSVPVWNWSGGILQTGGGTGTSTVIWNTPGVKNITLTVSANGCTSTTTSYQLTVNLSPTSTFTVSPNPICSGSNNLTTITYTGTTTASAVFQWNFVGGNTASGFGQGPFQEYWNTAGLKNVGLTITDANCSSTTTVPVTVNQTPLATFAVAPINTCALQNVQVTQNYPAGSILNWSWDGGTATPGNTNPVNETVVFPNPGGTKFIKLTVTENGCTSLPDSVAVFVSPSPTSTFTFNPTSACSGSNVLITYTGNGSSSTGYSWTVSGSTNPVNLVGSGPNSILWLTQGNAVSTENVTLVASDGVCSTTTTQSIQVTPIPTADFTITSPVCAGENATVNYIGNNAVSGAVPTFNWSGGIVTSGSGLAPYKVKWNTSGSYNVSLVVNQNGCSSTPFTANVNVLPNPLVTAHPDTAICPGSGVGIWAQGANSYVWQANNSTMPATYVYPQHNTVYSVIGTDNNGCQGVGTVTVNILNPPFVDAGRDTCILRGDTVNIGVSGYIAPNFHYYWTPNFNLRNDSVPLTSATPPNTTLYTLHITDNRGCNNLDSIVVCINACSEVIMPTAFSPNGDGKNERLFPANRKELIGLARFDIYNRWGVKVFGTADLNDKGWDGTYNGTPQELGVYTYFIEAICQQGSIVRKQGNVTLLR